LDTAASGVPVPGLRSWLRRLFSSGIIQSSACFINSVEDRMEFIFDLAKTEGMLFNYGFGSGTNLSVLREENTYLSPGGRASVY
jgi:Ribonucleotide reductase, barrel domain